MGTYAGRPITQAQIRATIALLRYFREFLASDCELCLDPTQRYAAYEGRTLTKAQARTKHAFLIDVAINRRAGLPDRPSRNWHEDQQWRWRRDQQRLLDIRRRVRVYQFETREVRRRFGHLLAQNDD